MMYVFDTDVFTFSEYPESPEYRQIHVRVAQLSPEDRIATTIITYEEQTRGWLAFAAKSRHMEHRIRARERLMSHLHNYLRWNVLAFDPPAAREFQRLKATGLRIGTADLEIAAITFSRRAVLVTRNKRHFQEIHGLHFEDWTVP